MIKLLFSIIFFCLSFNIHTYSQLIFKPDTRYLVVNNKDSLVNCNVLTSSKVVKKRHRYYYWYQSNMIHINQNDYSGKLLHGEYFVYKSKILIIKGVFKYGLKDGIWKTWDNQGNLEKKCNWKNGELNGKSYYFKSGKLKKMITYRDGVIHGKIINYTYKVTTEKYKKGKKKQKKKKIKLLNIIKLKRKDKKSK